MIKRQNIAKDVIKKKQRIAHNKTNEGHEMYPECHDFISSIMNDMDNTDLMAAMCLSNIQTNLPETNQITFHGKTQSSEYQIPDRSQMSISLPKLKKFGLSRKGPLMAKSQRTLQQLQHNRKLPKPRAHLAGLSKSYADLSVSESIYNSVSSEKAKAKDVNNARSTIKFQNKAATEKQVHNKIAADGNKIKRKSEEPKSKEITSRKLKPSVISKKCLVKEPSPIVETVSEKHEYVTLEKECSSDSDEYEKFIQKEKKDLPKKSKKTSNSIKSHKSANKVSKKHASKSVSTESESDLTDEESSNSYKSRKMRKTHSMLDNRTSIRILAKKIAEEESKKSNSTDEELSNSCKNRKRRKTDSTLDNRTSIRILAKKLAEESRSSNSKDSFKCASQSSDSEMSEGPSTSYKNRKKVHKKQSHRSSDTSKEDSESQMDINDETYCNYSSESEDLPSLSEIIPAIPSTNNKFSEQIINNQHKSELSLHSDKANNIPSVLSRVEPYSLCDETSHEVSNIVSLSNDEPNILQNTSSFYEIPNVSAVSNDQRNVLHKSSELHSLVGSAQLNVSNKIPDLVSLGNVQLNLSRKIPDLASLGNVNLSRKIPDLASLGSVHRNAKHVALQNNSAANNSHQENSSKSTIVDLVENNSECSFAPKIVMISSQDQSYCQSSSEDSEIEVIDVIVDQNDHPVNTKGSKGNVHKNAACTKNSSNELNIKTEKIDDTVHCIAQLKNTKSNSESQISPGSKKYEVAYITGICQKSNEENESKDKVKKQLNLNNEKSKSEDKILQQPNLNNELQSSTVSNDHSLILNKKVKKEPCGDHEIIDATNPNLSNKQVNRKISVKSEDSEAVKQATSIHNINGNLIVARENSDVENARDLLINKKVKKEPFDDDDDCKIILDITPTNNSSINLSNAQILSNRSIKVERDCEAIKQPTALHTRSMVQPPTNEINNLSLLNIKALLENLKKEFATYQEILVTEQSVESTFKSLEKIQAERLKNIKTQIEQCLQSTPSDSDCNSIKHAVNKLLDSSEINIATSLKDGTKKSLCANETSSDISMQDLTLASINLVPLSSISEKDIKPNISELQCVVKQEPSSEDKINAVSFGQKCILCKKDATAACQQCAEVFFCSNECGIKYWRDGHQKACSKM